jgi:hypothetical protein
MARTRQGKEQVGQGYEGSKQADARVRIVLSLLQKVVHADTIRATRLVEPTRQVVEPHPIGTAHVRVESSHEVRHVYTGHQRKDIVDAWEGRRDVLTGEQLAAVAHAKGKPQNRNGCRGRGYTDGDGWRY